MMNPADADPIADLAAVARMYFPDFSGERPVAGRLHLIQGETENGRRVVRAWPPGTAPAAARAVFDAVSWIAANTEGLAPAPFATPEGERVVVEGGRGFTARAWLPGSPPPDVSAPSRRGGPWVDLPGPVAPPTLERVATALGRLHALPVPAGAAALPIELLPPLIEQVQVIWHESRIRLRPVGHLQPQIQRWVAVGERALPAVLSALEATAPELIEQTTLVHRNPWPAHAVLDPNGDLTGLLGWERIATGHPLLDLARAIVRINGWSATAVELGIGAYTEARPLSPQERRLLPVLGALDLVALTSDWLVRLYATTPDAAKVTPIRQAAARMLESLENATAMTGSLIEPPKIARPPSRRAHKPIDRPLRRRR